MPYVDRDASGAIAALHRDPRLPDHEHLPAAHPDVQAFLAPEGASQAAFAPLDAQFVRVIEDVIDVLIARHVITITDLPVEAQNKLMQRRDLREHLGSASLQLFAPGADRGVI